MMKVKFCYLKTKPVKAHHFVRFLVALAKYGAVASLTLYGLLRSRQRLSHLNLNLQHLPTTLHRTTTDQHNNAPPGTMLLILQKAWHDAPNTNCSKKKNNHPEHYGCVTKLQNVIAAQHHSSQRFPDNHSITLATHCGISKLDLVLTQARWWGGQISAAIYLNKVADIETFLKFASSHGQELANVSLHVLIETESAQSDGYPHNMLRNLALDSVVTEHVLTMDADFITNPGAHDKMLHLIQNDANVQEKLQSRYIFALPPFDILPRPGQQFATEGMLPRTKEEVLKGVKNRTIKRFYGKTNPGSDRFHKYDKWYRGNSSSSTDASFIPADYLTNMEPYVLARRQGLPPYHEEFRGYGKNKVSWFWRLAQIEGYQFCVLQDFYVSHLHHPKVSKPRKTEGKIRNQPIMEKYMKDLQEGSLQKKEQGSRGRWL
jgi:hypothetical protein